MEPQALTLILVVLVVLLLAGGWAWPAPPDGHPTWSPVLYLLATVLLVVLLFRLLLVLL